MTSKYNKIRHLELLIRFLDFKKQDNNIYDLYLENRDEYIELSRYQRMLHDCFFWRHKKEFVLSIENYINDSIDFEQFEINFSKLWWKSMNENKGVERDLELVKNFKYDPKSDGFGSFMTCIFRQFEVLEDEECTEQEVKDYVRNTLQEIQPYL